jgi:hypothetical protein
MGSFDKPELTSTSERSKIKIPNISTESTIPTISTESTIPGIPSELPKPIESTTTTTTTTTNPNPTITTTTTTTTTKPTLSAKQFTLDNSMTLFDFKILAGIYEKDIVR